MGHEEDRGVSEGAGGDEVTGSLVALGIKKQTAGLRKRHNPLLLIRRLRVHAGGEAVGFFGEGFLPAHARLRQWN